ncbi:type IVB secretion system protein IcmH/DotU [Pseudomonas wadenswilerensis]
MSTITQTDNDQPKDKDPFAHDEIGRVDEEDADLQFQMRGHSINPLVDAAHPLFGMVIHVRRIDKADADALYRKVCSQITAVREEARQRGYDTATQVAYSYALCAFVDEAVMSRPWGRASKWSDRSLLSHHHNETCAGEKFFTVLARMQVDPVRYQHVLEVKYMCLCLGFQGKYAQQHDCQEAINGLVTKLHRILRAQRGPTPPRLFEQPKVISRRVRLERQWPLWTPYALAAVVLTGFYFYFSISLELLTEQVIQYLKDMLES